MSKRKPTDKAQVRERRNKLLDSAAAAELSLTEGVREMRAIAGMTQEEFAKHRGVSARVIKAIELGQGNPTVATLDRIGAFFGLEVAFVPVIRKALAEPRPTTDGVERPPIRDKNMIAVNAGRAVAQAQEQLNLRIQALTAALADMHEGTTLGNELQQIVQPNIKEAEGFQDINAKKKKS